MQNFSFRWERAYKKDVYKRQVRSIRAGAQGYLTKESAGDQLVNAIKKVASGQIGRAHV